MAGTLTTHEHTTEQTARPVTGGAAPVAEDHTAKADGNGHSAGRVRFGKPADPLAGAFDNVRHRPAMRFGGGF